MILKIQIHILPSASPTFKKPVEFVDTAGVAVEDFLVVGIGEVCPCDVVIVKTVRASGDRVVATAVVVEAGGETGAGAAVEMGDS